MGFEFEKRSALTIAGQQYSVDLSDVGFIEAVVTDFSALLREHERLTKARGQLTAIKAQGLSAEAATELSNRLADCNRRIIAISRGFIERTLGERGYAAVFSGRAPNSAEHIELCAYIYEVAIASRGEVVSRYVIPTKQKGECSAAQSNLG